MLMKLYKRLALFVILCFFGVFDSVGQIIISPTTQFNGCNGSNSGYISLDVSGGETPYSYLWNTGSTNNFLGLQPAGTYSVTVTDNAGSSAVESIELVEPPFLDVSEPVVDFNCVDSALVSLEIEGGVPPYNVVWSNNESGTAVVLPSGNFTVTVTDNLGCNVSYNSVVPDSFYVDLIIFDETCNLACDGSIFASVNGGSSPYTFDWDTGADTSYLFPLHADTFEITVTDGNGCLDYGVGIVDAPDPIIIEFDADTILCGADPFADVSVNVTGGRPPLTYIWSSGDTTSTVSDWPTDSMLTIIVQDSTGCFVFDTFYHNVHDELLVLMNIDNDICGGSPDGFITLDILEGEGPFEYEWSNGTTESLLFNLNAGEYSVTVTNEEGCSGVATGMVQTINSPLNALIVANPPSSCLAADGDILVQPEGGVGPYTFEWSNGENGPFLENLTAGFYTVTINDPLNCPIIREVDLNVYDAINVEIAGEDNLCEEGDSILLQASILDGNPPFDYFWNTGDTSLNIWVDEAGTYVFNVEDSLGCLGKDVVFIGDGTQLIVELFFEELDCSGDFDATAYVNLYYETGDPIIQWSTGGTGPVLNDLGVGTYSVTVTDDLDCPQVFEFEIEAPDPIEFTIETTDPNCFDAENGRIEVFVDDPNVSILWEGSGSSSFNLDDLAAGTYEFTLTDGQGCSLDTLAVLLAPEELVVELNLNQINCDQETGYIISSVSGGTAPYSYQWSTGATSSQIENLAPGVYTLLVTDALGCTAEQSGSILVYNPVSVSLEGQSPLCFGDMNGSINALVSGGTGTYSYLWSTGSEDPGIGNLSSGTYTITVCDEDLCCDVAEIILEDPEVLSLFIESFEPSCPDSEDGYAVVTANGGTGNYTYTWSAGGSETNNSGDLAPGDYSVTVEDENGCSGIASVSIEAADDLDYEVVVEQIICPDDQLGSAEISIDLTLIDSVLWSGPGITGLNSPVLDDVAIAGIYTYTIFFDNCIEEGEVIFEDPDLMTWEADVTNGDCGEGLGSISLFVDGGNPPYTYSWSTGGTTSAIENLENGVYTVTVTDDLGCSFEDQFTIENQSAVVIVAELNNPNCFDSEDGSISIFPEGGTAPYSYVWSTSPSNTSTLSNLGAGEVTVTVCDTLGCCVSETFLLEAPEELIAEVIIVQQPCFEDSNGALDLEINGGTPPYMIEWSTGNTGTQLSDLSEGTYGFTVTDEALCTYEGEFVLESTEEILVEEFVSNSCYGGESGSIELEVIQGQGPFDLLWSTGATDAQITGLAAGDYSYTLTDAYSCSIENTVTVNEEEVGICQIVLVEPITDCEGETGVLEVITDDTIESIVWSTNETTEVIANLGIGDYSVTLTDINGCISECSYTLTAPNALGDFVWYDSNADGLFNGFEEGLEGVTIHLFNGSGTMLGSTMSDADGYYSFTDLADGQYYIQVTDTLSDATITLQNVGSNEAIDSDVNPNSGLSDMVELIGGVCYEDLDVGFSDDCIPLTSPGAIGYDQILCGQNVIPDLLVETEAATGGSQPYEYMWLYSVSDTMNVTYGSWFAIPNSNTPDYQPGPLNISTFFLRCVRGDSCESFQESNPVLIEVTQGVIADFMGPNMACIGETHTFTAVDNDQDVTYEWYLDGILVDAPSDAQSVDIEFTSTGLVQLKLYVSFDDCLASHTEHVIVIDDPQSCSSSPGSGSGSGGMEFGDTGSAELSIELIPTLVQDGLDIQFRNFVERDIQEWSVVSLTGRLMDKNVVNKDYSMYLNTESYPAGVYVISLQLKDGSKMTKRFIKVE